MPFSISPNRANIISNAVQTASDVNSAKAIATKLSLFDGVRAFFSTNIGNGSFTQQLQEKNQLISDIVEKSFELKINIEDKLSGLDSSRPLQRSVQDIVKSFNETLPANTVNQIKYCFGYNAHDKNIVLRLKDGERNEEIQLLDLSQSHINLQVLDAIPQYWIGSGCDLSKDCAEQMHKARSEGILSANYDQFFKDEERQDIIKSGKKIDIDSSNASIERPSFVPKEMKTDDAQNKTLHAYSTVLEGVNPAFNDQQKNMFFMLCSQNASVGKTFPVYYPDVYMFSGDKESSKVDITTNRNNDMIVTIARAATLMPMSKGGFFNEKASAHARMSTETVFVIGQNNLVKCTSCAAPIQLLITEESLTSDQLFALDYLKEMSLKTAACFKDSVLGKIQSTHSYRQAEVYARQLEWGKSSSWKDTPQSALEMNSRFIY